MLDRTRMNPACAFHRWPLELALVGLAGVMLVACTSETSKSDVPECAIPQSAECAAARERFQVLDYEDIPAERLIAASSRAIGDLNFELIRRDDAAGIVLARYLGSAPTHKDQLDSRFHDALKGAAAQPILARINIAATTAAHSSIPVRLQLVLPAATGSGANALPDTPLDRIVPYQIFFEQLELELGGRVTPDTGDDQHKNSEGRRKATEDLPTSVSMPSGL